MSQAAEQRLNNASELLLGPQGAGQLHDLQQLLVGRRCRLAMELGAICHVEPQIGVCWLTLFECNFVARECRWGEFITFSI